MKTNWLSVLQNYNAGESETVPPGWDDVYTIAKQAGVCRSVIARKMDRLVELGFVEKRMFRVRRADGANHPTMHYREIKTQKKAKD